MLLGLNLSPSQEKGLNDVIKIRPSGNLQLISALNRTINGNSFFDFQCAKMVSDYGPLSISFLSRFVNVVDLCSVTHFCGI